VTNVARRPAGRHSYRALIAAAVPILLLVLANVGRTDADARVVNARQPVRRPAAAPGPSISLPDVRLAQLCPTEPTREPLLSRNPFAYAPRPLLATVAPSAVSIASQPEAHPDIPPSVPLSLIGIATTTRADGRVERTAVIAGPVDALYMVREADAVTARYRVDAVLPERVVLVDGATGVSLRLTMR
jgi:hypothetical protein